MAFAWLHGPPSVPIFVIFPFVQMNPKKFPCASYDVPVTTPELFTPCALFHQSVPSGEPSVPRSIIWPLLYRNG